MDRNKDWEERGFTKREKNLIFRYFFHIYKEIRRMSIELDRLSAEVAKNSEVDASAIALLEGLAEQIRTLAQDPAALKRLADDLEASSASLASAVIANTPAEPPV